MKWPPAPHARSLFLCALALSLVASPHARGAQRGGRGRETVLTLGLEQGVLGLDSPLIDLELVRASQTVAALQPKGADGFDFTPGDWLQRRSGDGFYHLGDLNLRLRSGSGDWQDYSTAAARRPVEAVTASAPVLAAADLAATLPADIPLQVRRFWEVADGQLALRFELQNRSDQAVEIGSLGMPMVFNNILQGRSLEEAHAEASFHDPYIGNDAGYLQVTRLTGEGPTLVVVPYGDTPFEAYNPLLSDPTRRGVTFEGFYEWMPHSLAHAENEWSEAEPWNTPTSATLPPGEARSYGVRFLVADGLRDIEPTVAAHGRPVAVGIPGYVLPMDVEAKLFLDYPERIVNIEVEPEEALEFHGAGYTENGWVTYTVEGRAWGRARLTVTYMDGLQQTIHYKVIKPATEVAADLGRFLTTEQWYEDPDDPFGRSPSVISYDYDERRQVTEDNRAWIAGLGDEGGSGSWLAAMMKQLVAPDPAELDKLQRFVDGVLWGGLQYDGGERAFGVRKSMFYYAPDEFPDGTYSEEVRYGGWSSWDREEATSVVRSYDYPHVAAAHWVLYRLARNHEGLVINHPWEWYLERAYRTGIAMAEQAPRYAQFGQMDGTVFLLVLQDLQREGWTEQATALEATMRDRAEIWRSLSYPFGSEMPWDSTGQEEVYGWTKYFGYADKAEVTLNAILGYMPTVPHWGYNGSARRYWDFQYAGKTRRVERQLHHYGSGLNAIPVLSEYRDHPDDLYLLRVGYGGVMGAIANITQDGFGPSGFHAYPSALRIDGYSGDYGPGFFGHSVNTGTYIARDPELGWLAFGGNLSVDGASIQVDPLDSARSRVYVAPLGLWLTLDAGKFEHVEINENTVRLTLSPATAFTSRARLRVEHPTDVDGVGIFRPAEDWAMERFAYLIPLGNEPTAVLLRSGPLNAEGPAPGGPPLGGTQLGPPPASLGLDAFYKKYVDASGIPVVSSEKVPDAALRSAQSIIEYMTSMRPDVRAAMIERGQRVGIMAQSEMQTDLPEYSDWDKPAYDDRRLTPRERERYYEPGGIASMTGRKYWNRRARGMGGRYTTAAEENILGYPGTRYYGEHILVHEFAHAVMGALRSADPTLYQEIQDAYAEAKATGRFAGHYAENTVAEYWAEGSQWWFWSNYEWFDGDTRLQTPDDLKAYDPRLYAIFEQVYAGHQIPGDIYHGKNIRPAR